MEKLAVTAHVAAAKGSHHVLSRKLKLYLPFLAIIVAQAAFVVAAPSNAPGSEDAFVNTGSSAFGAGAGTGTSSTGDGSVADGTPLGGPGGVDDGGAPGASPDAGAGTAADGSGATGAGRTGTTTAPSGGSGRGEVAASGDTSHCVGGKQFDVLLNAPACIPKWPEGADNGGATYTGVTADKIRIVVWEYVANQASNSILATQGLATTPEDRAALDAAAKAFIDEHYETYGRELEIIRVATECPTSPQDVPKCKQEARRVIEMDPFMVIIGTINYPEIYDEFARAGIMTLGGWHWPRAYFEGRRPFRFDLFADGDQSAEIVAEYYCKKLAGKSATNAGRVIHASIGGRDTPRKVGILAPDRDTDKLVAEDMARRLQRCSGQSAVVQTYSPDINEASGQAGTYIQRLIAEKVTTVVCFCDPVVPVYLFQAMSNQTYFPEHLTSGTGLLDYDKLGRLYDSKQWVHAFGPGHLFDPLPFDQQEVSRMWRASGQPGRPCQACNLNWSYYSLAAGLIHYAGPNLTPATAEAGVFGAKPYGGDRPGSVLVKYGPGDYGAISDAREIYWDPTAVSKIDGQAGAYVTVSGDVRYEIGEWTSAFDIPPASQ